LREVFVYDGMNRLLRTHTGNLSTPTTLTLSYLQNGNIFTRLAGSNGADTASYAYGEEADPLCPPGTWRAGPHAVSRVIVGGTSTAYCHDQSGNQIRAYTDAQNHRTLTYSVADHAREIRTRVAGIGERTEFEHGSGRERIVRRDYASENATTPVAITHYVGGAEVIRRFRNNCSAVNSALTIRREIAGVVVLHELPLAATGCESAPPRLVRQLRLTDHLGSTDALLAFDGTAVSGEQRGQA
jgi:hypothetical protein